jgi:hypothetical protein
VNSGRGFVTREILDSDYEFVVCKTAVSAMKSSPAEGNFVFQVEKYHTF